MDTDYIYLDHAATTPVDLEVFEAMRPYFTEEWGNPTSMYSFAQHARSGIDAARDEVAGVLNCEPVEVVFTSGGTESNNLAIKGLAEARAAAVPRGSSGAPRDDSCRGHIVTTNIEHHAVLHTCERLERRGFDVTYVPVSSDGVVSVEQIEKALRDDTILVSVMLANNEIGTIQPVRDIGKMCRKRGIYLHTDAVQAAGAIALDVKHLYVDMLSLAAHKFYGPKGAGCLYIRHGVQLIPQIEGGGQEHQIRSSTENVPGIIGMGKALVKADALREKENERLAPLREYLIKRLTTEISNVTLNGHATERLANNVNVLIEGLEGEPILLRLDFERS